MNEIPHITSIDQLNRMLREYRDDRLLLFKHSTACPISAAAYEEFRAFLQESPGGELKAAVVRVIEHRSVSNAIADRFEVPHQSPQALLIEGGRVRWHASHWNITRDRLMGAVADKP